MVNKVKDTPIEDENVVKQKVDNSALVGIPVKNQNDIESEIEIFEASIAGGSPDADLLKEKLKGLRNQLAAIKAEAKDDKKR